MRHATQGFHVVAAAIRAEKTATKIAAVDQRDRGEMRKMHRSPGQQVGDVAAEWFERRVGLGGPHCRYFANGHTDIYILQF